MSDEQRPDSLGCYGSAWARTPNIDRLAARGTVFQNAVCQSPVCVPSRSSQLSGRYPQEFGCLNNDLLLAGGRFPAGYTTFTQILAKAGYETVNIGRYHNLEPHAFGINDVHGDGSMPELAGYFALGEGLSEKDYHVIKRPGPDQRPLILAGTWPGKESPSSRAADGAIAFLNRRDTARPFLLRCSFCFPHTPTLAPEPFDRLYDPDDLPIQWFNPEARDGRSASDRAYADQHRMDRLSRDQVRQLWKDYMGCCAYVDEQVGRVVAALEATGDLENTIIFYSTDHGKSLGEWGAGEKGTFDSEVWRVPFVWSAPGRLPQGEVRREPAEIIDTGRTLFGLLGLEDSLPDAWRGRDLFADRAGPGAVFGAIRAPNDVMPDGPDNLMRVAVRTTRWRMDVNWPIDGKRPNDSEMDGNLFDLEADPHETNNRFAAPEAAATIADLLARLEAWLRRAPCNPHRMPENTRRLH
ncbi:MAG: sulfatase-like hydrolase/transferase [Phycisphaerae bacterium]|nr:sulfatase-like hydrolase/transferase [Phycisphaerae bacterium]